MLSHYGSCGILLEMRKALEEYLRRIFLLLDRNYILVVFLAFLLVGAFLVFSNSHIALRGDLPEHLYKAKNQPLNSYLQE